jgi:NADH-quinone oxidoreductase subunit N
MFLQNWIENVTSGLGVDLVNFLPELILCGTIVLLLLLRLFSALDRLHLGSVALIGDLLALGVSIAQWPATRAVDMFAHEHGLLAYDNFTIFVRMFLLGFTALVIWLTLMTGIPDREDSADFNCLLLGATLGMSLMASANHLLMVFIAVEMASLPSYGLAGFLKGKRQSSEASLKYVVYGSGASGIMLYGISLLAGHFGTGYLPDVALGYGAVLRTAPDFTGVVILLLGTLFVLIGIGFKLAAVPFHFWCPDVFEGASAEVAAFLSVASKGAALALLARFALALSGLTHLPFDETAWLRAANYLAPPLAVFAALTATFGNLAAYLQTNLKRLLAYSTIAQAGYMMMGLATLTAEGASAVLFYLVVYLFMNLGAFAIVAFLRNQTGSEDLNSYRGLIHRSPVMVVTLGVFLFSLIGMPPFGGFAAKLQVFLAVWHAAVAYGIKAPALANAMYALVVIGLLNSVISLVYYIKVLTVMVLQQPLEEVEGRPPVPLPVPVGARIYASLLAVVVFALGIYWGPLGTASEQGAKRDPARAGYTGPFFERTTPSATTATQIVPARIEPRNR